MGKLSMIGSAAAALAILVTFTSCRTHGQNGAADTGILEVSLEKQAISLGGVANARQFGGYVIDGKEIRKDVLLRSGNLSKATAGAVDTLRDVYHLKYVFDFRSSMEHDASPDRKVEGATELWLPCLEKMIQELATSGLMRSRPDGDVSNMAKALLEMAGNPASKAMVDGMYPGIVFDEAAQKSYSVFLDSLAVLPEGRAALWHCSQGKDRCGWGSALLLAALGADRELIVKDFALSNTSYQPLIDKIVEEGRERNFTEEQINIIYGLIGVSVTNFNKTYDQIIERYGSMDNYLTKALDCDEAQRRALRERFLVPIRH